MAVVLTIVQTKQIRINIHKRSNTKRNTVQTIQITVNTGIHTYRGADTSLARPGRKQAWKHVRDARDFHNIETRAVIKVLFMQGKAPKEVQDILTEILVCFLPGQAKDLSAPLYYQNTHTYTHLHITKQFTTTTVQVKTNTVLRCTQMK